MQSVWKQSIIAILFIFPITLLAQTTYNSRADGTWSTDGGATSCGCQPDGGNDIIIIDHDMSISDSPNGFILNNSSIILNAGVLNVVGGNNDGSFEMKNGSAITVKDGATLNITWDLILDNGSVIDFQTGSSIIVANDFTNKNNSTNVFIDGSFSVGGDFSNGNGSLIEFGSNATTTISGACINSGNIVDALGATSNTCVGSILPISLLYFQAVLEEDKVVLSWMTVEEQNNDYFTLERSTDGVLFTEVERITGAGNSSSKLSYTFTDEHPLIGVSYYRLSQTDYDGTTQSFNVVYVKNNNKNRQFRLYPNPISGSNLTIFNSYDEINVAIIYNVTGSELQRIPLTSGINSVLLNTLVKESGIYFLHILNSIGESVQIQKLIVN